MKTNHPPKTARLPIPRPTRTRPAPDETHLTPLPTAPAANDFLDFCLYPGMKTTMPELACYPTAV